MFDCLNIFNYSRLASNNHFNNIAIVLCLIMSFSVSAALKNEAECTTPTHQQQKDTHQPSLSDWLSSKYNSFTDIFKCFVSDNNLAEVSEYYRSQTKNDIYLQSMRDDNHLYSKLEKFKDKESIEVLTLLYAQMLLRADGLYQVICNAKLQAPPWLQKHQDITQELKRKMGSPTTVSKLNNTKFIKQLKNKNREAINNLNKEKNCFFYIFQALLQYKGDTNEPNPTILLALNEQINLIACRAGKYNCLFTEETIKQSGELLSSLSYSYQVRGHQMLYHPLLTAFSKWNECYPSEKISKLLADSTQYKHTQNQHIKEKNKEHQHFFAYLNCKKEVGKENIGWYDANQAFIDNETKTIIADILNTDIIKNMVIEFPTVKYLNTVYENGKEWLNNTLKEQKNHIVIGHNDIVYNKKDNQDKKFNDNNKEKYLQDCILQNMKNSYVGKLYYGISNVFSKIKSALHPAQIKEEQSNNALIKWALYLESNAEKFNIENGDNGHDLVMQALLAINKKEGGEITLANAVSLLIEQRFESEEIECAFTLLTGLKRTIDRENKSYCYKPLEPTDSHCFADTDKYQQKEYSEDYKKESKEYKQPYSHVEYASGDNYNNVDYKSGDWLSLAKNDYLLETRTQQQTHNTDYSTNKDEENKKPQMHNDWCLIIAEMKESDGEQGQVKNESSLSYGKRSPTLTEKMLKIGIGLSVVLMCAQGISCASESQNNNNTITDNNATETTSVLNFPSYPGVINIHDVSELNMIGKNISHPIDGHYQLMNSFDVSDFKESINIFNGTIQGNCQTLYNFTTSLIVNLIDNGVIEKITVSNANIRKSECAAIIAETASGNSIIRSIKIDHCFLRSMEGGSIGAVACITNDSAQIENIVAVGCDIVLESSPSPQVDFFYSPVGGVVGLMSGNSMMNYITVIGSDIRSGAVNSGVGGIMGYMIENTQAQHLTAIKTNVTASSSPAYSGGAIGRIFIRDNDADNERYSVNDINCIEMTVTTNGDNGYCGGAIGQASDHTRSSHIFITSSRIKATGEGTGSGCVVGSAYGQKTKFEDLVCIKSTIESEADAGGVVAEISIGAIIKNALVSNCTIKGLTKDSFIGGAAGVINYGFAQNIILTNSKADGANESAVHDCAGRTASTYECTLAEGVYVQQGNGNKGNSLLYTSDKIITNCEFTKLHIVSNNCIVNKEELNEHEHIGRWYTQDKDNCIPPFALPELPTLPELTTLPHDAALVVGLAFGTALTILTGICIATCCSNKSKNSDDNDIIIDIENQAESMLSDNENKEDNSNLAIMPVLNNIHDNENKKDNNGEDSELAIMPLLNDIHDTKDNNGEESDLDIISSLNIISNNANKEGNNGDVDITNTPL